MAMPVKISDVLNIATDMQEVRDTPLSVSLVIDPTADSELSAHVRAAFASEAANTRVRIGYVDDAGVLESERSGDDMAVLVAGTCPDVGRFAESCRFNGTPTMVVTSDREGVLRIADEVGSAIPDGDVVVLGDGDDAIEALDARMGKWMIEVCRKKDLALAYSFPFVRRPLAKEAIFMTSLQNAAVGFVPVLPGADMPVMTLNQIKMTLQIATAYGQPVDGERIKEIVAVVGGAFVCRHIVRSVTKVVPAVGWLASGAMGFAATEAMGRALLEYFEAGGDIVGVANVLQTARDAAVGASQEVASSDVGKAVLAKVKSIDPKLAISR